MTAQTPAQIARELQATFTHLHQTLALLEPHELETARLAGGWSPQSVLAHVAFWDDFQTQRLQAVVAGKAARNTRTTPLLDNDQRAQVDAARPWDEIVAEAEAARAQLIAFAVSLSSDALDTAYAEGKKTLLPRHLLNHMIKHTHLHTQEIARYCGSMQRWSRATLRSFLVTQHANLMDSISGLTEATILATPVCGAWTMRDVLVHVLSWHEFGYQVLKQWPKADPATLQAWLGAAGTDVINARLLAARADLDMIGVVDWLTTYHRRMIHRFDQFSDAALASQGDYGWGETGEASGFFYELALHDAEHAEQIWRHRANM